MVTATKIINVDNPEADIFSQNWAIPANVMQALSRKLLAAIPGVSEVEVTQHILW